MSLYKVGACLGHEDSLPQYRPGAGIVYDFRKFVYDRTQARPRNAPIKQILPELSANLPLLTPPLFQTTPNSNPPLLWRRHSCGADTPVAPTSWEISPCLKLPSPLFRRWATRMPPCGQPIYGQSAAPRPHLPAGSGDLSARSGSRGSPPGSHDPLRAGRLSPGCHHPFAAGPYPRSGSHIANLWNRICSSRQGRCRPVPSGVSARLRQFRGVTRDGRLAIKA
jgi:hypothetical protein